MNAPSRRLSVFLLTVTLLALPVAAHAEPMAGRADRWLLSALDLLGELADVLRSIDAESEVEITSPPLDDGDTKVSPQWDPNGSSSQLVTSEKVSPQWDPNG